MPSPQSNKNSPFSALTAVAEKCTRFDGNADPVPKGMTDSMTVSGLLFLVLCFHYKDKKQGTTNKKQQLGERFDFLL